jgi:hypothetical protein
MTSGSSWTSTWSPAAALSGSREPALALVGETPHLVWYAAGTLYHSYLGSDGWSTPALVAMGAEPALAATPDGDLHCLFSNTFAGNYEIYHVIWHAGAWSLPHNVSHTTGASTRPSVTVDQYGILHAVWTETTPGQPVIYYGQRADQAWSSAPIPNSRGVNPVIASGLGGVLYVAWQDTSASGANGEVYDIYCGRYDYDAWQIPENVSDTPAVQSIQPSITVDSLGLVHLVWQEQQDTVFQVYYCERVPGGWAVPANLTENRADCLQPQIVANPPGMTQLVWLESGAVWHQAGQSQGQIEWWPAEPAAAGATGMNGLAMAVSQRGSVHVAWSALSIDGGSRIYYAQREPVLKHRIFFPIV